MHDAFTFVVVVRFRDEKLLEIFHLGQDSTTEPAWVLSVCWREHLRLHWRGCKRLDLLRHARIYLFKHRAATCENDVAEKVPTDVKFTLHDWIESALVNAVLNSKIRDEMWLEKNFRAFESLLTDIHPLAIRKFVAVFFVLSRAFICCLHLRVVIDCDLSMLNFDLLTDAEIAWRITNIVWVLRTQHLLHKPGQVCSADWHFCCCER